MEDDFYNYLDISSSNWESTFNEKDLNLDKKKSVKLKPINIIETDLEKKINKLEKNCKKYNYNITKITNLNGDCLFEVLVYNELGENVMNIRNMIAALFISFRNVIGFFDKFENNTLEELFNDFSIKINKHKKYSYDVMCNDIIKKGSWMNLPTNLILMVISRCFNIKFVIINSDIDNLIVINECKNVTKEIGLGFLPEFHYIGITKNN